MLTTDIACKSDLLREVCKNILIHCLLEIYTNRLTQSYHSMPNATFAEIKSTCFISEHNWDHALGAVLVLVVSHMFSTDPAQSYINQYHPLLTQYHPYLIFVIFFTRAKFLENKIYTKKTCKLRQNTQ